MASEKSLDRTNRFFSTLKTITASQKGITRLAFTDQDWETRNFIQQYMKELGLTIREDAFGNYFGRWEGGTPNLPPILIGSHMDSVPEGGNYDGPVGVWCGLEVIHSLQEEGVRLQHPLEVAVFMCEESSRFKVATLGSRAFIGDLTEQDCENYKDSTGHTLKEILMMRQLQVERLGRPLYPKKAATFLEVHIEQGKVLESENKTIGVVTGIAAPSRYKLRIQGKADHSGATPMNLRNDALCGAAEVILCLEELTRKTYAAPVVGTIGVVEVSPGSLNVIPGEVELGVDIRSISMAVKDEVSESFLRATKAVCEKRHLSLEVELLGIEEPVSIEETMQKYLVDACEAVGVAWIRVPSGAGHDAMNLAKVAPTGMLFIPCEEGISHNALEKASHSDIVSAITILRQAVCTIDNAI